jgi:hypothetical protein
VEIERWTRLLIGHYNWNWSNSSGFTASNCRCKFEANPEDCIS